MRRKPLSLRFVVIGTLLGNTVQWYDYHLFNFLAPILSLVFFPPENPFARFSYPLFLIVSHAASRVLGALVFGYQGNKRGRRFALMASIGLMTLSSFCIGVLPSFATIGDAAPLLFLFLRCLQSFAAGGEFTGGMLYLVEMAPPAKRAFYGSFSFFGLSLGVLFSSLNYFIFGSDLTKIDFFKWGWRFLYLFGAFFGFFVFLLRRRFHETHLFIEAKSALTEEKNPLLELFHRHKRGIAKIFGIGVLEAAAFNLLIGFLIIYWNQILNIPMKMALKMNLIGTFFFPVLIVCCGKLAQSWHVKKQAAVSAFLFLACSIPLVLCMQLGGVGKVAGLIAFLALLSGYMAVIPSIYCEIFPTRVRFLGVSLGYNLAVALIGGTAPETVLYMASWQPPILDIGLYLSLAALISLVALFKTKEKIMSVP